jgi:uncharacterized protein (TIGR02217 family)
MTTFIETPRFPTDVSYDSRGGPGWETEIVEEDAGSEKRNQRWSYPRHEYDVAYGIKTREKLETVLKMHWVCAGRAIGFRYKDHMDWKSCDLDETISAIDCIIGTGTGALATFQLYKTYIQGAYSRSRKILKPIGSTVAIAVDGVGKTVTTHFTVNSTTGLVTFTAGNLPGNGAVVTAGFEFDVPVRFDADRLSINLNDYKAGAVQVPLIELKYGDI